MMKLGTSTDGERIGSTGSTYPTGTLGGSHYSRTLNYDSQRVKMFWEQLALVVVVVVAVVMVVIAMVVTV